MKISSKSMRVQIGSAEHANLIVLHISTDADGLPETISQLVGVTDGLPSAEEFERIAAALCKIREEAGLYSDRQEVCIDHGYYQHFEYKCPACAEIKDQERALAKAQREADKVDAALDEKLEEGVHPALTEEDEDPDADPDGPDPDAETDLSQDGNHVF